MPLDREQLFQSVCQAVRSWVTGLPPEDYYVFALYTCAEVLFVGPSCNSLERLSEPGVRWSPCDWPLHLHGEQFFASANQLLAEDGDPRVWAVLERALQVLDGEGLFGRERTAVLLVMAGDQSEKHLQEVASRLNPPHILQRYPELLSTRDSSRLESLGPPRNEVSRALLVRGDRLVVLGDHLELFRLDGGERLYRKKRPDGRFLCGHGDLLYVIWRHSDHWGIDRWSLKRGRKLGMVEFADPHGQFTGHGPPPHARIRSNWLSGALSNDGQTLALATDRGTVRLVRDSQWRDLPAPPEIRFIQFAHSHLICIGGQGMAWWDLQTWQLENGPTQPGHSLAVHESRCALVVEGGVVVWDFQRGQTIWTSPLPADTATWSDGGDFLATGDSSGTVRVFRGEDGVCLTSVDSGYDCVHQLAFIGDGRVAVVGGFGGGPSVRLVGYS